jgi:hypothetical protein
MPGTLVELAHDGRARKPVLAAAADSAVGMAARFADVQFAGTDNRPTGAARPTSARTESERLVGEDV